MNTQTMEQDLLQWHPAFYAGLQVEFQEEANHLIFENEHQLGTKPKEIDVLIVKKNAERPLKKNIGRLFRKHNIFEYKSPDRFPHSLADHLVKNGIIKSLSRRTESIMSREMFFQYRLLLLQNYQKNRKNTLYQSLMNIIVRANEESFKAENNMCQALWDLFKDELNQKITAEAEKRAQQQIHYVELKNHVRPFIYLTWFSVIALFTNQSICFSCYCKFLICRNV